MTLLTPSSHWEEALQTKVLDLDKKDPGHFGLYVKDLSSGKKYSFRGEEDWYLASGVKVPVALELLLQVEKGKRSLSDEVEFTVSDLIDGSPAMRRTKPGRLSLEFLLEQMLVHSDNTATDLVLKEIGLRNVNARLHRIAPRFHEITTLSDVRRLTYSGIFPRALSLKNEDILRLKSVSPARKVRALASVLEEKPKDAHTKSLHAAFSAYYGRKLNSAPLEAYGSLLEKIEKGEILSPESRKLLLEIMERVETGRRRIRAALPPEFTWAHKTGTQYERACDFGFAWPAKNPGHKVVIAACTQGLSMRKAESLLRQLGRAVRASGVLAGLSEKASREAMDKASTRPKNEPKGRRPLGSMRWVAR